MALVPNSQWNFLFFNFELVTQGKTVFFNLELVT